MNLEELKQWFADARSSTRYGNWLQGDIAAEGVREYGRAIISMLAETGGCSKEHVRQLLNLALAFPEKVRYLDVDWSVYRAVYYAAKRLNKDPIEVLQRVLEAEMSAKDIAGLGREKKRVARLKRTCPWCGAKVVIEMRGMAGEKIYCPCCRAVNDEEHVLGVLEEDA